MKPDNFGLPLDREEDPLSDSVRLCSGHEVTSSV